MLLQHTSSFLTAHSAHLKAMLDCCEMLIPIKKKDNSSSLQGGPQAVFVMHYLKRDAGEEKCKSE